MPVQDVGPLIGYFKAVKRDNFTKFCTQAEHARRKSIKFTLVFQRDGSSSLTLEQTVPSLRTDDMRALGVVN